MAGWSREDFFYGCYLDLDPACIISVNAPAELAKWCFVEARPLPNIFVIGDTSFADEMPLMCLEYPFLARIIKGGGFDFDRGTLRGPVYLVGEPARIDAHAEVLRLAFLGPERADYRRWNVDPEIGEQLLRESESFRLRDAETGASFPLDYFIRRVPFVDGEARIDALGLRIAHTGHDCYDILRGDARERVALGPQGRRLPYYELPRLDHIEQPHHFRVVAVGTDSGMGTRGGTTTFLLELAGELILFDCSPYVTKILHANGVSLKQVRGCIVTHIHGDHAEDVVALALNGHKRMEIWATREVWRSLLVKVACYLGKPEQTAAQLFIHREIRPGFDRFGESVDINGFDCAFFYGVHPIPSVGVRISQLGRHVFTISGDTALGAKLMELADAGVISEARRRFLMSMPEDGLCLVDVGSAIIHPNLEDLEGFDWRFVYIYHRSELPAAMVGRANLALPGQSFARRRMGMAAMDACLMRQFLDSLGIENRHRWSIIFAGMAEEQYVEPGHLIIEEGSDKTESVYVITHGEVEVRIGDETVARLERGDHFGEESLFRQSLRNANVWARSDVRLLALPRELFLRMTREDEQRETATSERSVFGRLERLWRNRRLLADVFALKRLSATRRHELALECEAIEATPGQVLAKKNARDRDVYVLVSGVLEVDMGGGRKHLCKPFSIVGERTAIGQIKARSATVRVLEPSTLLRIPGDSFCRLYRSVPALRFDIDEMLEKRRSRARRG
jgi:CRP-like cAMP-binding protein